MSNAFLEAGDAEVNETEHVPVFSELTSLSAEKDNTGVKY